LVFEKQFGTQDIYLPLFVCFFGKQFGTLDITAILLTLEELGLLLKS
jgi:hypothetical protein